MIDLIRQGLFRKDETVLFWHTGGQPALFAEKYANQI
jgi:1-aminocyclopropane-1-carboxylate deaminase/D-cysteine desulfhydrase-like pyridoxal-dependent ACC family enzyme